jgi:hypothetical protein
MATTSNAAGGTDKARFGSFDVGNLKFPSFDDLKSTLPVDPERVLATLRDAVYVVVGFGVLTVQQIQSRTRDLVNDLGSNPVVKQMGLDRTQIESYVARWESQLESLDQRFDELEARLDTVVEKVEARLPEQAATVLGEAHDVAKAARKQIRGMLRAA